ncbi:MAG: response regulator transcription factor [Bacteroidia bacterium]|nr:response regulator transcription factor [Bacteroidia bacterium]
MIKAVIIDDEKDARFLINNLLAKNFAGIITVLGEADDVNTGIKAIETHHPQVVFLDIKMPSGTGFDLLQHFKSNFNFEVVFITAYDEYAIKAFQFSALGYLLKPVKTADMAQVISRLQKQFETEKIKDDQRIKVLIENSEDQNKIKKLVVTNINGFQVLSISDIVRLEGDRNYTHFIMSDGKKITTSKTLGDYENLLHEFGFFRAHQSTIINLRFVKAYKKSEELIEMLDNKLIKLSRHRKSDFIQRFV